MSHKKNYWHPDIAVLDRIIRKPNTALLPPHALLPQLHLEVITSRPEALLPVSASWLAPVRSYKCALLSCPPVKYSGLDLPKTKGTIRVMNTAVVSMELRATCTLRKLIFRPGKKKEKKWWNRGGAKWRQNGWTSNPLPFFFSFFDLWLSRVCLFTFLSGHGSHVFSFKRVDAWVVCSLFALSRSAAVLMLHYKQSEESARICDQHIDQIIWGFVWRRKNSSNCYVETKNNKQVPIS